MFSRFDTTL